MRLVAASVLAFVSAASLGCARYSDAPPQQGGYNQGGVNPGQWQPMPQPGMGPQQPYGYGQPQPYGYGQPQPYQQPYPQQPYGGGYAQPYEQVFRPVNVPALMAMQGRIPCAPKEVAPGTWATFDCAPFQALQSAVQYIPFVRYNFLPTGPLPAAVDHRTEGHEGPVKDQGAVGACTALSLSTAMENAVRRMGRQDTVSALHIWSRYGVGVTGQAGDSNVGKSVAVDGTWPYDPTKACKLSRAPMDTCGTAYGVASASESFDPELKAEHTRADASGRYKLTAVEQLHARPADPNEIAGVLAGGDDIWISFSVNDQAWMSRSLRDGVIPDYETVEDTGHAVVLAGFRTLPSGTRQFLVHNSWSTRWGNNGYGWISEAMVSRYTRAAYRVRVADGGGASPIPGAVPGVDQGGCPAGQVKAPILGACVPAGGLPGFPGIPQQAPPQGPPPAQPPSQPGLPPGLPQIPGAPAPKPQPGSCPSGQAPDMMSGRCTAACPGGAPSVGGMCLPVAPR
jgi:hypothetical protein